MVTTGASFLVVANRLPVDKVVIEGNGEHDWRTSPGGLVTALEPVMRANQGSWVGWTGAPGDDEPPPTAYDMRLVPVYLTAVEVAEYYEGFANSTLWPLYHDVTGRPHFSRHWWEAYVTINRRFAEVAAREAAHRATVWVQDYQLQLVPAMLRALRPDVRIGFFNHIPFPGYEIYSRLPWRRQVVEGLLGGDLIGFQRADDAGNFLRAARRTVGVTTRGSVIELPDRQIRATAFPISIDSAGLQELALADSTQARAKQLRTDLGDPRVML
ncbi:MAG: trehalose-6-phosphate synthase, partial [Acidimicrobiaceae bacterium]|nr:trehalose-6-phosphate synthase [Acidimicrobiaceae bacterium]